MKNLKETQFSFTSEEWNKHFNYCEKNYNTHNAYDFAMNVINSLKDMFSTSADVVAGLLSISDFTVFNLNTKKKYLVNSQHTPAEYRKHLIRETNLNTRLIEIIKTMCTYQAYKAYVAGRRWSAFDGWGDSDAVKKRYEVYFNNTVDSDWTIFREYIIEVAESL